MKWNKVSFCAVLMAALLTLGACGSTATDGTDTESSSVSAEAEMGVSEENESVSAEAEENVEEDEEDSQPVFDDLSGTDEEEEVPDLALDEEDEELLDAFGDDLIVVAPEDFAEAVGSLTADSEGLVYQLTGYYMTAGDGATDYLVDSTDNISATLLLRYLPDDLTMGGYYTVTGIVALEEHGDHSHIVFDVVLVETYAGE